MTDETFDAFGHAVEEIEVVKPLISALTDYISWMQEREGWDKESAGYVTRDAA